MALALQILASGFAAGAIYVVERIADRVIELDSGRILETS